MQARLRELRPDLPVLDDVAPSVMLNSGVEAHNRQIQTTEPVSPSQESATTESLMWELELARALAMAQGQTRSAITATVEKARLQGLIDASKTAGAPDDISQHLDLSHLTDEQLATLEAIFGPLAAAAADDGGDHGGEDTQG